MTSNALRRMVSHISIRKSSTTPSGRTRFKKAPPISHCSSSRVTSHGSCLSPPHLPRSSTSITTDCLESQHKIDTVPSVPALSALDDSQPAAPISESGHGDIGKDYEKESQSNNVLVVIAEGVDIEPRGKVQSSASSSLSGSQFSSLPVEPSKVYSVLERVMEFDAVEADSKVPYSVRPFDHEDVQQSQAIFKRVKHFERFAADRAKCLATKRCLSDNICRTQSYSGEDHSPRTGVPLHSMAREHSK